MRVRTSIQKNFIYYQKKSKNKFFEIAYNLYLKVTLKRSLNAYAKFSCFRYRFDMAMSW